MNKQPFTVLHHDYDTLIQGLHNTKVRCILTQHLVPLMNTLSLSKIAGNMNRSQDYLDPDFQTHVSNQWDQVLQNHFIDSNWTIAGPVITSQQIIICQIYEEQFLPVPSPEQLFSIASQCKAEISSKKGTPMLWLLAFHIRSGNASLQNFPLLAISNQWNDSDPPVTALHPSCNIVCIHFDPNQNQIEHPVYELLKLLTKTMDPAKKKQLLMEQFNIDLNRNWNEDWNDLSQSEPLTVKPIFQL